MTARSTNNNRRPSASEASAGVKTPRVTVRRGGSPPGVQREQQAQLLEDLVSEVEQLRKQVGLAPSQEVIDDGNES